MELKVKKRRRWIRFLLATAALLVVMLITLYVFREPAEREIRKSPFASSQARSARSFCRRAVSYVTSPHIISTYMRTHSVRALQIGAGTNNLPGWLNTDIEPVSGQAYLDATKPFPLPDQSFKYIFSEQVIEHLTYEDGLFMLKECYRVLTPGGKIRLATPNLLKFVELFQGAKTEAMQQYMQRKLHWHGWPTNASPECYILNLQLRSWGHEFVYDPRTLTDSLERAGFRMVTQFPHGASDDPQLRIEFRHEDPGISAVSDYEAMVFQAVRP